jgi:hypothetical protein
MATFNTAFQELADSHASIPGVHPIMIAFALSMLINQLAATHYDVIFLSAILVASCQDIEEGKYDCMKKTH